jgi:hypothetical protein
MEYKMGASYSALHPGGIHRNCKLRSLALISSHLRGEHTLCPLN